MNNNEKDHFGNPEFNKESLEAARNEHQERLKENLERNVETKSHEALDTARQEALEQAHTYEKEAQPTDEEKNPIEPRTDIVSKREKDKSFNNTMAEIRRDMPGPSKAFSSFIHNKAVEKVSDTVGGTVARPNAILSGSVFAFVLTLTVYLIANYNGYPLSGSETIASFALGWVIGLIIDYVRVLVFGKSH